MDEFEMENYSSNEDEPDIESIPAENPKNRLKRVRYEDISDEHNKNKKKSKLDKVPTVEELNNLKETENLYNNNLFRLQISELIKEVSVKNKRKTAFKAWFETFKQTVANLPDLEEFSLSDIKQISKKKPTKTEKFINKVWKRLCYVKTDQDLSLKLSKPEDCACFGLQEVESKPGPCLSVDIMINMPRSYFNTKDFVNNRYFIKRYYYLLYIMENVSAVNKCLVLHEDIPLLPIVNLQPTEDNKISVNIYVVPPKNYFKPNRFLPNINNVKQDVFTDGELDGDLLKETPTILYNTALGFDVTLQVNDDYLRSVLVDYPNVQEALKLLSIWIKQRELDVGFGGLKPTLMAYLTVFLIGIKKLNKPMSSYQVVRNVWSFLTSTDLTNFPICLGDGSNESIELYRKNFPVIILDYTGCYNLAAYLSRSTVRKISSECGLALKQLDSGKMEAFQLLFLNKCPFHLQFDMVVDMSSALPLKKLTGITTDEQSKQIGFSFLTGIKHLSSLLETALNRRITQLVPRIITEYSTNHEDHVKTLLFGVNLDVEKAFDFIERGPALSDHVEAEKFRKFWGRLSSDRRFRDGSTHVAVHFNSNTIRAKRNIVKRIVKFILDEKLRLKFQIYYDEMEEFIINKRLKSPYPSGTNEEDCVRAVNLADELGQKIRQCQSSLSVSAVVGISDTFSYTDACTPIASAMDPKNSPQRYLKPIESILNLEHSTRWPRDLPGIRYLKTSFLLEISDHLRKTSAITSVVTRDWLDVYYQGLAFRYRLYVPKEVILMKQASVGNNNESLRIERDLTVLPRVIAALRGIQFQYPSFGAATSLIKKWIRSQLMDGAHVTDVQIDLLSASLYLRDSPYLEPATPQAAFLRFLQFMREMQFDLQPVIVNFNQDFSKEDLLELEGKFQENRASLQPLYILMPYDKGQSLFTTETPTREVLLRLQQLADACLTLISNRMYGHADFDLSSLFTPNMDGYDVIIHINPEINTRKHEMIGSSTEGQIILEPYVEKNTREALPQIGFSPVDFYLSQLRKNYGDFATFFHNTYGGNNIGVLWNPSVRETKEFKVTNLPGRKLNDNKLTLNTEALIDDFYFLGKDIVKWIEKK